MKRGTIFLAALLSIAIFTGCNGTPAQSEVSQPIEPSSAASSEAEPSAPASEPESSLPAEPASSAAESSSLSDVKTFGFTTDTISPILKEAFADTKYPNAFDNDPKIDEMSSEELGNTTTYTYNVIDGIDCVLYAVKETDELFNVYINATADKLDSDKAATLGFYLSTMVGLFEPDSAELQKIDQSLDIAKTSLFENTVKVATGSHASFSYIINDGMIFLMISPS